MKKKLLFIFPSSILLAYFIHQQRRVKNFFNLSLAGMNMILTYDYYKSQNPHQKAALYLYKSFQKNGGLFIKFGQLIASLDAIIPNQYRLVFKNIFKGQQKYNKQLVKQFFQQQTGQHFNECFINDSIKYISTASISQVYSANLKENNKRVILKLQHKNLKQDCQRDISMIKFFINIGQKLFPQFKFKWFGQQLQYHLPVQLNFKIEAQNTQKALNYVRKQTINSVIIPQIYKQWTTQKLLVQQFIEGQRLDKAKLGKHQKKIVAKILSEIFNKMIFQEGWFHADPHMANFLWKSKQKKLVMLDHALYQKLSPKIKNNYSALWNAMLCRDFQTITNSCKQLGDQLDPKMFCQMVSARPYDSIVNQGSAQMRMLNLTQQQRMSVQVNALKKSKFITQSLHKMNRQLFLVFKVNDMVRFIVTDLGYPSVFLNDTLRISGKQQGQGLLKRVWRWTCLQIGLFFN